MEYYVLYFITKKMYNKMKIKCGQLVEHLTTDCS